MSDTGLLSIREILGGRRNSGWLFLPEGDWTPDTEGAFVPFNKEDLPPDEAVLSKGLRRTVDSDTIEDIIANAEDQIGPGDVDRLFEAFLYYCRNDAFIQF